MCLLPLDSAWCEEGHPASAQPLRSSFGMQVPKGPGTQPPDDFIPTRQPHTYSRRWVLGRPAASESEVDALGATGGTLGDSLNSSLKRGDLGAALRKLEKAQKSKAAARRAMFKGRSAEAMLYKCGRKKEPLMDSMASMDATDLTQLPTPSKSSSLPSLSYFDREPVEYAEQHYAEAARQARSYLRGMYREVPKEWPPPPQEPMDKFHTLPPPRTVYGPQPFVIQQTNLDLTFMKQEPVERDANPPRRQAALKKMRSFGASCHGAPYTLSQVYEEIDAKLNHKKPRDVRSVQGKLGPLEIGAGTSPRRRNLPFLCNGKAGRLSSSDSENTPVAAIKDAEPENSEQ